MTFDDNQAGEQRSFEFIPDKTVAVVQLTIRPGAAGPDGILRRSKTGEAEMLDCELIVVGGPYRQAKILGAHDALRNDRSAMPRPPISRTASSEPFSNSPAGSNRRTCPRRPRKPASPSMPTSTASASSPRSASNP